MRYFALLGNLAVTVILLISTFLNPPATVGLVLFAIFILILIGFNIYYLLQPTEIPTFITTYLKRCNVDQEIKLLEAQNRLKDCQKRNI